MFVALSHCNKQNLYMLPKNCQKCKQCSTFWHWWPLFGTFFGTFMPYFAFFEDICFVFWNFLVTYTDFVCCSDSLRQTKILFVAVAQCHKPKFGLSQWLSATNNREKLSNFFVVCNKEIGKKAKYKHPSKFEFHQCYQIGLGYLFSLRFLEVI